MGEISRQIEDEPTEAPKFRSVRMEDCGDMVAVWDSLVEEKAPIARQTPKTKEEQLDNLKKITEGIEKGEVIYNVAEESGHVVGWASVSGVKEKENRKVGTLGVIVLEKKLRGKGIAGILLEKTIEDAQRVLGINEVELEVFAFNEPATRLYEKHGFAKIDEKVPPRDYYGEEKERIKMLRRL